MISKRFKWVGLMTVLVQLAIMIPFTVQAEETRTFAVTAYYSPLPGQSVYMRGSYEADIRLNGRGTNGADGTEVYVGMLAAPKSYAFGTQIYIPGLGVGTVHDRGGAILARENYDRIDVWMGHGEEGLARALNWGYRFVEGSIVEGQPDTLDYSAISTQLPKRLLNQVVQNPEVFDPKPTADDSKDIKALQEALTSFGYYNGELTGEYDDATEAAVTQFQLDHDVIDHEKAAGAGNYGPKTRAAVKDALENFNASVVRERKRIEANVAKLEAGLGTQSEGEDVYWLQQMLWELGYYHGELNGQYDDATIDAVFEFQKARGVLESESDSGAGFFGNRTHAALLEAVTQRVTRLTAEPIAKSMWAPAKQDWPTEVQLSAPVEATASLSFDQTVFAHSELPAVSHNFQVQLDLNDRGADVVKLQEVLIAQGYLEAGLNTGYFGSQTQAALVQFQLDHDVIATKTALGAGRVGPATLSALNALSV